MKAMFNRILRRYAQYKAIRTETRPIRKSSLFDRSFYLEQNPDVRASGMDPAFHYLRHGGFEGRNPSPLFDSQFYLEQYPDVKASGMNPLWHYEIHGKAENRLAKAPGDLEGSREPAMTHGPHPWLVPLDLAMDATGETIKVNYFDETSISQDYGTAIAHWDGAVQQFWRQYIDRRYQFFVLSRKLKPGHVLDVGAEFYNKHVKEVIAPGQSLTIVDIKDADHPDIKIVRDLDHYLRFDMTRDDGRAFPELAGRFDTALSFGVLSYYDFTPEMCSRYIDNMYHFLKRDGLAIFKVDRHMIERYREFPAFSVLHRMILARFQVDELDVLTSGDQAYFTYYGRKKNPS
jgi:hypothetical protein